MTNIHNILSTLLIAMLVLSQAAFAQVTHTVTSNADDVSLSGTLRHAIGIAQSGDTIVFDLAPNDRTIVLDGEELFIDKDLTIDASALYDAGNDVPGITIDAGGLSRVFRIYGSVTVNLIGLTITGGNADGGGGGIYVHDGRLTVTDCRITGNKANTGGGIFVVWLSTLTVTGSTISDNTARWGGGISNDGTLTVTNSTISGNTAGGHGGGIYAARFSAVTTITDSEILDNTAGWAGGGIANWSGTLTITDCIITGNAAEIGGGILHASGNELEVTDSEISDNTAEGSGGGIWHSSNGTVNIVDTTFTNNRRWPNNIKDNIHHSTLTTPLVEPRELDSTGRTTNSVSLRWEAVTGTAGFEVRWKLATGNAWFGPAAASGTSTSIQGLTPSTAYDFQVRAVSGAELSYWSVPLTVSTLAPPPPPPPQPSRWPLRPPTITSVTPAPNGFTVSWNPVLNASSYRVQWSNNGGRTWTSIAVPSGTRATVNVANATGQIQFRVLAIGTGIFINSQPSAVWTVQR